MYDYKHGYDNEYFRHFLQGTIVWENSFYDYEKDQAVTFFDYIDPERPIYRYYLYYGIGNHTFHQPIKDPSAYDLPVKEIDTLHTSGKEINDLVSMQFVDKVLALIDKNTFEYVCDIETTLPEFPDYKRNGLNLQTPTWNEIWACIYPAVKTEPVQ